VDASLSHTQIRGAVTEHIGLMTALSEFKCSHNAITALPQSFGALSNLACLDCSHNSIAMLPQVSLRIIYQVLPLQIIRIRMFAALCVYS
jgi:Leucine-rich repeat (LRR) protein